ncbi:MAG: Stf0 family sulfotransferase [Acidimicrobiales bacterium]
MHEIDRAGSYLICATPRTGSTLLCGLLGDTGIAGKPESYFRLPDERSYAESWSVPVGSDGPLDYRQYIRAVIAAGSTTNGVFAARVMWGTMEEVVTKLRAAYHHPLGTDLEVLSHVLGRTRFVHLQRGDVLAQAVSWARAEQTGYWQCEDRTAPGRPPRFDLNEVDGCIRTINAHNAAWRDWFGSSAIAPLVVTYEDLVADMARTAAAVLGFVGLELPVDQVVAPRTRRQADELNQEWASRYRSLRPAEPWLAQGASS